MEKYINGGLIMLNKKITKVLGNNEVKLSEKYEAGNNEFCHDVEFYSDAGEDVVETVFYDGTSKDFVRAFKEMADDFDAWVGFSDNGIEMTDMTKRGVIKKIERDNKLFGVE